MNSEIRLVGKIPNNHDTNAPRRRNLYQFESHIPDSLAKRRRWTAGSLHGWPFRAGGTARKTVSRFRCALARSAWSYSAITPRCIHSHSRSRCGAPSLSDTPSCAEHERHLLRIRLVAWHPRQRHDWCHLALAVGRAAQHSRFASDLPFKVPNTRPEHSSSAIGSVEVASAQSA